MNRHGTVSISRSSYRARRLARRAVLTLMPALLWAVLWHGVLAGAAAPAPFPPTSFAPSVSEAMHSIYSTTLTGYVGDLSGEWPVEVGGETVTLGTRYSLAEPAIALAERYALEQFAGMGVPAACHTFTLELTTRCNIVAEKPGVLAPDRIVILGAHLDSITTSKPERLYNAPGADDNASGSAAVLAAAGVLRDHPLPFTVRYVLFTGEEQGLYGSRAYAEELARTGEQIIAMVNLDMIGYSTGTPDIDVHIRAGADGEPDYPIADVFSQTLRTYNLGLVPRIIPSGTPASDHASFWDMGFPAVLIIEDFTDFNPYYHTTQDLLSNLNVPYYTKAAQAVVATVMQLAGAVDFATKPGIISIGSPFTLWAISHVPDTLPVTYSWDLGNGVLIDGPTITPTFSFGRYPTVQGSWPVTMTVSYQGESLHISKRLPVYAWNVHLPVVLRVM